MKYFFDVQDGGDFRPDADGRMVKTLDAAKQEAIEQTSAIAQAEAPDGGQQSVETTIRNERGETVIKATLRVETLS